MAFNDSHFVSPLPKCEKHGVPMLESWTTGKEKEFFCPECLAEEEGARRPDPDKAVLE